MLSRLIVLACLVLAATAACQPSPSAAPSLPARSPVAPAIEPGSARPDATLLSPTPDVVAPDIELGTPRPDPTLGLR